MKRSEWRRRVAVVVALCAPQALTGQVPVEVPLSAHGGRLVIPVAAPDGSTLDFIVTTGSSVTVLAESVATRLGSGVNLTLGGLPVPMEGVQSVPDASLRTEGRDFAGMIAGNMLSAFDVLLDLPRGRMILKPVGRAVAWEGVSLSQPVRLRVYHGVVLGLDVGVNGKTYPAMLELGTPDLRLNQGAMTDAAVTGGKVRALRLGAVTFADVPAQASDHPILGRFSPNGDPFLLVGAAIARDCAVSLSWVHRELRTCVR